MARKFIYKGREYKSINFIEGPPGQCREVNIKFTKHDIGTWSVYVDHMYTGHGNSKEEALLDFMVRNFGGEE